MRKIFILASSLLSMIVLASTSELLNEKDFSNMPEFRYNPVVNVERVFIDEIQREDLYMVTYMIEGDCFSAGETDACEQIEHCEYVWVDVDSKYKKYYYPRFTDVLCKQSIEDVIEPIIIDEY